ncbi:MAG: hypothetical protein IKH35_04360 [Prevotella sp.]|nr:hypothetical protein [Prevotella sp.]
MMMILLSTIVAQGQIKIGGNVYGGGNHAEVKGSTKVTVSAGDIGAVIDPENDMSDTNPRGRVFGGARMANVGGNTLVHIDGENASDYILINHVYGGNDIAGEIGTAANVGESLPSEVAGNPDGVDNTYNSYVHLSSGTDVHYTQAECDEYNTEHNLKSGDEGFRTTDDIKASAKKIFIGQVFAGGNGDFDYTDENGDMLMDGDDYIIKERGTIIARSKTPFVRPELDKAYLDIQGGTIFFAYGGGNNATIKEKNVIHVDNPSEVVTHILANSAGVEGNAGIYTAYKNYLANQGVAPTGYTDLLTDDRIKKGMGIRMAQEHKESDEFQIGRLFGGNNLAAMDIMPTWNLQAGMIRNLYSGGNHGDMTSPKGLLLEINPLSTNTHPLIVDNVYGGCRMADVKPTVNGEYVPCTNLEGYNFPNELSARTLIRGGDINNVYGGNDVTGTVYGGNAIGIYATIRGDVYGGGNGAYAYTDNPDLENDDTYGDFYYPQQTGMTSGQALNAFRPNAEQVSIRLKGGGGPTGYTIIKGSVFLGGNCASLATKKKNPMIELKIGSYVIADKVFLGNNGAGMVSEDVLKYYAGEVDEEGNFIESGGTKFSTLDLKDVSVFKRYMTGVAMPLKPNIVFDNTDNGDPANYEPFSSFIGSFYCGGNVGSMTIEGKETFTINQGLNIYEKFVGGCNNADVKAGTYNTVYQGGVIGTEAEQLEDGYMEGDKIKDRIEINLENLTITPLRWNDDKTELMWNTQKLGKIYTAIEKDEVLKKGDVYYTSMPYSENTVASSDYTVKESDKFFKKLEDNVYINIATGTVLPVGSKYYTYSDTGKNTVSGESYTALGGEFIEEQDFVEVPRNPSDHQIRLIGGNVYGGCYESGHVHGNVIININQELLNRDKVFGTAADAIMGNPASGVEREDQRDDLMAVALSVFGAGCGEDTEVWGSTTVNHNNGYAFQIYGGGEEGMVGKSIGPSDEVDGTYNASTGEYSTNGKKYKFDTAYSSTVNLSGNGTASANEGAFSELAETEYIYGGGNEGDVCGNTLVNLGNGRVYDAFGGACDADILGHAELYIGRQPNNGGSGYKEGFPWVKDIVYGGNDFGGTIYGEYEAGYDFTKRVRNYATVKTQLHGYTDGMIPDVLKSSAYVEYLIGRVDTIFGGGYGSYDYTDTELYGVGSAMPKQHSSYVNIRPKDHKQNALKAVFGGGTGYHGIRVNDEAQDRSYVLIDIPDGETKFKDLVVFGAGSYNGVGMQYPKETTFAPGYNRDQVSAIIDLLNGEIGNAYGGSYNEGNTCRTVVNVPEQSTIKIKNIFGGAFGTQILPPCDVIQAIVNYKNTSEKASVSKIYGGNNNERRALFTQVNISSPVWSDKTKGYLATVYGAGHGIDTWSEHTQVNLLKGAKVYEVYGGGEMGHVLNAESIQKYMQLYKEGPSSQVGNQDPYWKIHKGDLTAGGDTQTAAVARWAKDWKDAWKLGKYYEPNAAFNNYFEAFADLRSTSLVYKADIDDRNFSAFSDEEKDKRQYIYSTNVIINDGAEVLNYAYGGGYGDTNEHLSGDVYGHTYIALLGGTVKKDIYAAGTSGAVNDIFGVGSYYYNTENDDDPKNNPYGFTASTTAYIKGGTCRNVYGGGWKGNVGAHSGSISDSPDDDIPGETHVVIGDVAGSSFTSGIPAVQRNVYGGGEGGAVFGKAYLTVNNGYVGYQYNSKGSDDASTTDFDERYEEKIEDDTKPSPNTSLEEAGCVFGGGYIDNSTVDKTYVTIYGGNIRNSVFGGGEIAAIGRGDMKLKTGGTDYELNGIYRPGKTNVKMYSGHVHRNVFGGGRGYDNLSGNGSLHDDGYVFGQTEVSIHGGQIGTASGVADGDGNVFGGGDLGFVYSAYENSDGTFGKGVKSGVRYNAGLTESDAGWNYQGYYYKHAWADDGAFVTVEVPTSYYTAEDSEVIAGEKQVGDVKTTKTERQFTEDCKVLVEPMCKVLDALNIDGTNYSIGDYVPIEKLNKLQNKNTDKDKWDCLDQTGIIIHNAVFAGGNAQSGSMTTGANTNTVFGNATASINDIFHRDLITLGTRHTGGLYGDGNLTLVDGYRELNITNYGTDYYSIAKEITIDAYHELPDREAAYYELNYTCMKKCQDKNKTIYTPADPNTSGSKAATITAEDMLDLFLVKSGDTYVSIQNNASGEYVQSGGTAVLVWNEIQKEWEPNSDAGFWKESGVLPVYAGRLMNSIQRADLCGIFGSRMVMQGAQDRVPEEVDFTNYTINRVREVSLNKMDSKISSDLAISEGDGEYYKKHRHGNYFGIYNVVNYLGALTSDVKFTDMRKTDNNSNDELYKRTLDDGGAYGTATYYDWKKENIRNKTRNNGNSHNKVALASGVYLELTTEESTGDDLYEKVWGPITGIVELDLINVSTGIGGGFVYAKNIHGIPSKSGAVNTTLTKLNEDAVTQWDYTYDATDDATHQKEWESSGNFVHSTQTIIDDCYNVSNRYYGDGKMPAHFWYIKGSTYVYDQYISAYTGQSNAFSEVVDIPLTIAAASHGKMKLLNVMPNRYAYYSSPGVPLGDGKKMIINGKTYYKNDPISYWDWYLLSNYEKELFVGKTYVNCITCKIDGVEYAAGTYVMTDAEFTTYKGAEGGHTYTNAAGEAIKDADDKIVDDDYIFRESNNVSHDEGYILTYEVNNPSKWDNWFTPKSNTTAGGKITLAAYEVKDAEGKALYEDGPTYRLNTSGSTMLGQSEYKYGDLIPEAVQSTYTTAYSKLTTDQKAALAPQATFEKAYIVKNKITMTEDGHEIYYNPGTTVSASFAGGHEDDCEEAYICTKSIELTKDNVIYRGSKLKKSEAEAYVTEVKRKMNTEQTGTSEMTIDQIKDSSYSDEKKKKLIALATLRDDLQTCLVQAYYCTSEPAVDSQGNPVHYYYGGNYYESGHNYRGLEAWSSMSKNDRAKFDFNYDALDLLIDPDYTTAASGDKSEGHKYQYDSAAGDLTGANNNPAHYSLETAIDYTATYNGGTGDKTEETEGERKDQKYMETTAITGGKVYVGDELTREQFESLPNEQRHYSTISVKEAGITYYVVNTPFQIGSTPYAIGETISSETYKSLTTTEKGYVTLLTFVEDDVDKNFYYCREAYTIETTHKVKSVKGSNTSSYDTGATVPIGAVISAESSDGYTGYSDLANEQRNFTIHGISPTETSTLYVSRESDIYDLSKEKIITVIYQYDYDETDTQGNVTPISERHVLNIHLTFKSGVPTIEDITPPEIILPGDKVTLAEPTVTPGAYEVTGYGWELFATPRDAESHTNGVEYNPTFDKLYWYQDNYYVAYYAKSYLGRTYSNAVPVRVANYHDLADVMSEENKSHHMYIDHKNVKRAPKIYINDYNDIRKNGLDLFKNLYDLSVSTSVAGSGDLAGHALLNERVNGGSNLEFFMRTDIDHTKKWVTNPAHDSDPTQPEFIQNDNPWTPIASGSDPCFSGNFHGDGHTISGLNPATGTTGSLFHKLCGNVYNLGVMGSFNGAGIADEGDGYVESCWVKTTNDTPLGTKPYPVFGAPSDDKGYQVVNSYYFADNKDLYNTTDGDPEITYANGSKGVVTRKSAQAFYNGELAYDLNNFYLYKRYSDKLELSSGVSYDYFTIGEDNKPVLHMNQYYAENTNAKYCSSGTGSETTYSKYVEDRFADGDYRYVGENRGVIPDPGTVDERHWIEVISNEGEPDKEEDRFSPIWPDDYIFFGQKLNYGYDVTEAHQEVPTAVARDGGRLSLKDNANRVYRAPAYYRSKVMGVAYFNPTAYLAQKEKLSEEQIAANKKAVEESRLGDVVTPREAYPSMTAIDFAGHNKQDEVSGTYTLGSVGTWFYQPLLDDDGLLSIQNCDETQNLLVYAPAESATDSYANQKTHAVLTSYFKEPEFVAFWDSVNTENRYTDGKIYKRVADATAQSVYGHLVQSNLKATNDHLLVDKQDFNAPFGYSFDSDRRMWYQRKPENYVDLTQGWEGISLPFTVELVTTDVKGELTHFYQGNTAGHEYWLREYKGNLQEQTSGVYKADFDPLAAGSKYKNYTNTFLWDYYYSQDSYLDKNDDEYQKKYYSSEYLSQCYPVDNYPYSKGGTPYIIGFPGKTYYEFDLSGNWTTLNRYRDIVISSPGKQIVTFASVKGGNIGVSDEETVKYINKEHVEIEAGVTANGYTFKPSYMNYNSSNLEVAEGLFVYLLDSDGASFKKTAAENVSITAFRPYFIGPAIPPASSRSVEQIVFGQSEDPQVVVEEHGDPTQEELNGGLRIWAKKDKIYVESSLSFTEDMRVVTPAGITVATFSVKPGKTVEVQADFSGMYIVHTLDGKYTKKVTVKK